jgi:hypothetical protein
MNCRYFACSHCLVYIDAGYRWAYWLLEDSGHVQLNEKVDVAEILDLFPYWNPPPEEQGHWLCQEILPAVKKFFKEHQTHCILYVEEDVFACEQSLAQHWTQIETKRRS